MKKQHLLTKNNQFVFRWIVFILNFVYVNSVDNSRHNVSTISPTTTTAKDNATYWDDKNNDVCVAGFRCTSCKSTCYDYGVCCCLNVTQNASRSVIGSNNNITHDAMNRTVYGSVATEKHVLAMCVVVKNYTQRNSLPLKWNLTINVIKYYASVIALLVTMCTYMIVFFATLFIVELRKVVGIRILYIYFFIFLHDIIFLFVLVLNVTNITVPIEMCKVLAFVVHFSLLWFNTCLLGHAVLITMMFPTTLLFNHHFTTKQCLLPCFGLPFLITGLAIVLDYLNIIDVGYGINGVCTIGTYYGNLFFYIAPILLFYLISAIILSHAVIKISTKYKVSKKVLQGYATGRKDLDAVVLALKLISVFTVIECVGLIEIPGNQITDFEKIINSITSVLYALLKSIKGIVFFIIYMCTLKSIRVLKKIFSGPPKAKYVVSTKEGKSILEEIKKRDSSQLNDRILLNYPLSIIDVQINSRMSRIHNHSPKFGSDIEYPAVEGPHYPDEPPISKRRYTLSPNDCVEGKKLSRVPSLKHERLYDDDNDTVITNSTAEESLSLAPSGCANNPAFVEDTANVHHHRHEENYKYPIRNNKRATKTDLASEITRFNDDVILHRDRQIKASSLASSSSASEVIAMSTITLEIDLMDSNTEDSNGSTKDEFEVDCIENCPQKEIDTTAAFPTDIDDNNLNENNNKINGLEDDYNKAFDTVDHESENDTLIDIKTDIKDDVDSDDDSDGISDDIDHAKRIKSKPDSGLSRKESKSKFENNKSRIRKLFSGGPLPTSLPQPLPTSVTSKSLEQPLSPTLPLPPAPPTPLTSSVPQSPMSPLPEPPSPFTLLNSSEPTYPVHHPLSKTSSSSSASQLKPPPPQLPQSSPETDTSVPPAPPAPPPPPLPPPLDDSCLVDESIANVAPAPAPPLPLPVTPHVSKLTTPVQLVEPTLPTTSVLPLIPPPPPQHLQGNSHVPPPPPPPPLPPPVSLQTSGMPSPSPPLETPVPEPSSTSQTKKEPITKKVDSRKIQKPKEKTFAELILEQQNKVCTSPNENGSCAVQDKIDAEKASRLNAIAESNVHIDDTYDTHLPPPTGNKMADEKRRKFEELKRRVSVKINDLNEGKIQRVRSDERSKSLIDRRVVQKNNHIVEKP